MAEVETFAALNAEPGILHGFTQRAAGLDMDAAREVVVQRLAGQHEAARAQLGVSDRPLATAEQVHGAAVAIVDASTVFPVAGVDGLITADPRVCLGIYVADCCAVYLVEPERKVIALLHSGRRGSEAGIARAALEKMRDELGCNPARIIAQLSPCIRPPHYESDFAAQIVAQCRAAGVLQVDDCGLCTASHPDRYYSYRAERGRTGRMLALLALRGDAADKGFDAADRAGA